MTIQEYLTNLCEHLGLLEDQFSIDFEQEDNLVNARINLSDDESGLFIGYHGETLRSLQRVVRTTFFEELSGKIFRLNINDYKQQRQEQLREKVKSIALRVLETKEPYVFSNLTSYDRYLIHTLIGNEEEFENLTTASLGEGKDRQLTISIKQTKEQAKEQTDEQTKKT
jgi:predicted RNA-binding protein Jag